jgi:hypothetical protein
VTARMAGLVVALALGCDPVMGVRGDVRSVPRSEAGHGVVYDSGRPIYGAGVFLLCSSGDARKIAESREDGTFSFGTAGWLRPECIVEVRATGYHTERISLRDLCVHADLGACHWANVSAELVPLAQHLEARTTAAPAKPAHLVEFTATTPKLEVLERGDQKLGLVEYEPLGAAPLSVGATDGKHRFAAAFEARAPIEAPDDIVISGPTRVDLEYVDRSSLRTWKWVAFYSALVVGPVLAGVGVEAEGAAKPILIGTGIVVGVSGLVFAMDVNETTDQLRTRATPLADRPPRGASTLPR